MFKRKVEDSGKNTLFQFSFKIFFIHIINIIIMIVLGMLLENLNYFSIELDSGTTSVIITCVCMFFYLIMAYLEGWRRGERDYNLVLYKHMDYQKLRGFFAGLISQIPGIVCSAVIIFQSSESAVSRFVRSFYVNCNYLFVYLDTAEVSGIIYHLCYFLPAVIAPLLVGISYDLGYKRIRVSDKLIWSKSGNKIR